MLAAFLHNDIDYFPFLIQSGISFFVLIFHEMVTIAIVYRVAWWLVPVKMHKVSMIFLDSLLFGAKIK